MQKTILKTTMRNKTTGEIIEVFGKFNIKKALMNNYRVLEQVTELRYMDEETYYKNSSPDRKEGD